MHTSPSTDPLEILWDNLLSCQPDRVRATFTNLTPSEKKIVLDHLNRMASEPGWHPEQQTSARLALSALAE